MTAQRLWRVCVILPLVALAAGVTRAQEVISNPGFEQVDAAGVPVDWEPVGVEVSVGCDKPCTDHYLRLYRDEATTTRETGFNRRWVPDSGEQGAMLSQLRGAIRFRYRAISARKADLCIYVIPMSDRPWEDTGERRARFVVPDEHIGDGRWHEGALKFDFTAQPTVNWCHVSGRIVGIAGELWVDDFQYVERLGPYLRIDELKVEEIAGTDGKRFRLNATITNAGDAPATDVRATASAPKRLTIAGDARTTVPTLEPDGEQDVSWEIAGERRDGDRLEIEVASGERADRRTLVLRAELSAPQIEAERFVLAPGETTTVRCRLTNTGTVPVAGAAIKIEVDPALEVIGRTRRSPRQALPGQTTTVTWRVRALKQTPSAAVQVRLENVPRPASAETELVVAPGPPTTDLGGVAAVGDDVAWLWQPGWRLVFPRAEFGFGVGWLQVKRGDRWVTVGVMPRLARVEAATGDRTMLHLVYGTPYVARSARFAGDDDAPVILHEYTLGFNAAFTDAGGGRWTLSVGFAPAGSDMMAVHYALECDRPRRLLDFQGPMLWVGEGSESERSDAIFPGLEWLVGDEVSSSTLDISEDHPDRDRYHPHPNKITVPAMGVRLESGAAVGLIWDPQQRWDGIHDRPSAVFSSPDQRGGRASHLIGLFLPSIPEWVPESPDAPRTGYPLDAYREVTLNATIMVKPDARDSLAVMDRWYELNGAPEPMPMPRGEYEREIAFSMRAYLESLWLEDEQQWWTSMGGGSLLSRKSRPPAFVYDLLVGAALSPDRDIAQRCRERAQRMIALTGNPPASEELGLAFGGQPDQHLIRLAGKVAALIAAQRPDGSWRFDADHIASGVFKGKDYHDLGPDDAAEIGTCARNAYEVLRYLRISGDPGAGSAALRALEFMNQFRVPRAAQVWEVPVHTPDVLAAADAVEAYLEGYRVFGDRKYLDQATYWARAGLPFIYVWGRPEFPYMLYGSIPVFGATWHRGSWFGRLVQWNGLRYSNALLKLTQYDDSFPWRTIADGIVRSAIHQQATDDEHIGLWPDSIGLVTGRRCPWIFTPHAILKNVYALTGLHPEPETAVVRDGEQRGEVRISATGAITEFKARLGQFECTISEPKVGVGYVLVAGIDRPGDATRIMVDGQTLEERSDLEASGQPGWWYNPQALLVIAPPRGREQIHLMIEGFQYQPVLLLPDLRADLRFEFDRDAEGWVAEHDVEGLATAEGRLRGRIAGGDPYLVRRNLAVEGDGCRMLMIRMRVTGGRMGQVYWTTETSPAFAEDKVVRFNLRADGDFHKYRIAVAEHPLWRGQTITALRIDPNNGAPGSEFEIDWIRCR